VALAGTIATIGVHLALAATSRGPYIVFIAGASLFWAGWVIARAYRDTLVFRGWGFRAANLLPCTLYSMVLFTVAAAVLAVYAGLQGTLRFPLHTVFLLGLYPIWGIIQQFLALAVVVGNLELVPWLGQRKAALVVGGALLFGLVHFYDLRLVAGTFLLELATIALFLRYRNLWPLGVMHGWLGGLFYIWVLNRDLWADTVG
jgi:hypothetical protein